MSGVRCIDGRLMKHQPFSDDPDFEHDIGECPACEGFGCGSEPVDEDDIEPLPLSAYEGRP